MPNRPAPGTIYGGSVAQTRIGTLLPDGTDKWWRVHDGASSLAIAQDVLADVEAHGLPWLRLEMEEKGCT